MLQGPRLGSKGRWWGRHGPGPGTKPPVGASLSTLPAPENSSERDAAPEAGQQPKPSSASTGHPAWAEPAVGPPGGTMEPLAADTPQRTSLPGLYRERLVTKCCISDLRRAAFAIRISGSGGNERAGWEGAFPGEGRLELDLEGEVGCTPGEGGRAGKGCCPECGGLIQIRLSKRGGWQDEVLPGWFSPAAESPARWHHEGEGGCFALPGTTAPRGPGG